MTLKVTLIITYAAKNFKRFDTLTIIVFNIDEKTSVSECFPGIYRIFCVKLVFSGFVTASSAKAAFYVFSQ
ncbi:MAG TPA: hypothetical protein DHU65_01090 [Clostridiales bacterium]|nr:hypothetical protein [Clostridiales bacterium]